ncbi:MAG: S8 family serine peptidase [Acidobacteriota bacterium]
MVIGVIDDGLQGTHPDLAPNYAAALSWDFRDGDGDPTPADTEPHGTAVGGVAAGTQDNANGGSGVAPSARLAGLRLPRAESTDSQEASALAHRLDDIHVVAGRLGPADDGKAISPLGSQAKAALQNAAQNGRSGKGRVFVWPSGDGAQLGDDCNYNEYANSRFTIAAGAVTDAGHVADYSEPCAALVVVAPSSGGSRGLMTTDLQGSPGYATGDYTDTFGGTGGASAIVAGVAALMLERNAALTWRDVQGILRETSVRLDPADADWTAGLFPHHHRFGFGLLDAHAAVSRAGSWSLLPPETALPAGIRMLSLSEGSVYTEHRSTITIASGNPSFTIEHVEVDIYYETFSRGSLVVTLTSPQGVVSQLMPGRPRDGGNEEPGRIRLGSVRHWGEPAAGVWTLRVTSGAGIEHHLWQWTLRLFGTSAP